MCGGGGGTPKETTSNVTQTSIPQELMPYAQQMMGRASSLTDINQNPFQQYQGQRIADFSPLRTQAFQGIQQMQPSAQIGQATGMAGLAGLGGLGTNRFDNDWANFYMSPYMQNVVESQKREARRDATIAGNQRGAQAATTGAFGGNRQSLLDAEANRDLGMQLGDIQARGLQSAWDQAQNQFNADEARRLQGLGLTAQSAGIMGQLGDQAYNQQMGIYDAQQLAGKDMESKMQDALTMNYQDFLNQQNYPYQQLAFMSDLLHGLPTSDTMTRSYTAPGSTTGQLAGLAGGLGSLFMGSK